MNRALLAVALLAAVSCGDSSGPNVLGTMTFTYTGAGGGTFTASGNAPSFLLPPPTTVAWAVGFIESGEGHVAAASPRTGGRMDLTVLRFERTTVGSATIDPACNIDGGAACTGMELLLNFNGDGDTGDFFCALTSGTIDVTEISGTRAKGTFSGTGTCITGTGGAPTAFAVTNGTFDVAMVAPPA